MQQKGFLKDYPKRIAEAIGPPSACSHNLCPLPLENGHPSHPSPESQVFSDPGKKGTLFGEDHF